MLRINVAACVSREETSLLALATEWVGISDSTPAPQSIGLLSLLEDGNGHWGYWLFVGGLEAYRDIGLLLAISVFEDGLYWTIGMS